MAILFDFGISQEDPLTEQFVLNIQPGDKILSVASGGEVPLSILSLIENISITAVDIFEIQIRLCQLKLLAAIHIDFPLNGRFLGYANLSKNKRNELYRECIYPHLSDSDMLFWDQHIRLIEKGIVNAGRFEQYIGKMRFVVNLFVGKKNLLRLINSKTLEEQKKVFYEKIATRKSLQLLFKIAFHPAIYKKRGLQEQALIHASKSTGERFYSKFEGFCTAALAAENYFLQYFLAGNCITNESFPAYLQPANKGRLMNNLKSMEFKTASFENALCEKEIGYFNKVHLSNLGDWMSEEQFHELSDLLKKHCSSGTSICYRYLQKNHFQKSVENEFTINTPTSLLAEQKDRFPFYGILHIVINNDD